MDLSAVVSSTFSDVGPIARAMPGFEPREGQRRMAAAVATAIEDGQTLLAEAGTGTGKTLAYLIPAILSRQRVLVSTGTKNLQEQVFFKDLPALRDTIDVPFTATLMKGRSNYLCLHRWENYRDAVSGDTGTSGRLIEIGDHVLLPVIQEWAGHTRTGDRAELRDLPEDLPLWKEISADADTCLGTECPRYGDCFLTLMRQRAAESDVVIVNHHLLCADASVRQGAYGEVIPSCPTLVVDEAHQLEDVATQYFGVAFSNFRVDDLVHDAERLLATTAIEIERLEEAARALTHITDRTRIFFAALSLARTMTASGGDTRVRYTGDAMADCAEEGLMLAGALEELERALGGRRATLESETIDDVDETVATIARRARDLRQDLRFLLRADDQDFVFYLEQRGHGTFLRASPVDVSRIVRDALFDRFRTVVLTSATLAVDGSFDYIKGRLGIGAAEELRVPSEFDYGQQALLYLPRRMPPPKSPTFAEAVARETIALLTRSRGRAFVLFTSYRSSSRRAAARRDGASVSDPGAGQRAAIGAHRGVQVHAERGPARDVEFLAGGRRRGRLAQLRGDRQAAVRVARGPGDLRPHRGHQRPRRGCVCGVPGAPGHPLAPTGAGPADSPQERPRRAGRARFAPVDDRLWAPVSGLFTPGAGDPRPRCGGPVLQVNLSP